MTWDCARHRPTRAHRCTRQSRPPQPCLRGQHCVCFRSPVAPASSSPPGRSLPQTMTARGATRIASSSSSHGTHDPHDSTRDRASEPPRCARQPSQCASARASLPQRSSASKFANRAILNPRRRKRAAGAARQGWGSSPAGYGGAQREPSVRCEPMAIHGQGALPAAPRRVVGGAAIRPSRHATG